MNKDNETYLKLFWGRSNHRNPCLLPRKAKATAVSITVFVLFCFAVTLCAFAFLNSSTFADFSILNQRLSIKGENVTQRCPKEYYYPTSHNPTSDHSRMCPSYFKWIHEDLKTWREKGLTREMLERGRKTAHLRVVIVGGKVYVEKYRKAIQTRDVFTLWGILQLMRMYPGKLPDLELMFDCDDRPVIPMKRFQGPNAAPPPLFRYSSDHESLDIVFPDWSFWGW